MLQVGGIEVRHGQRLGDNLSLSELHAQFDSVIRADHPLAEGSEDGLQLAALADEPFVFFPRSYGQLYGQFCRVV